MRIKLVGFELCQTDKYENLKRNMSIGKGKVTPSINGWMMVHAILCLLLFFGERRIFCSCIFEEE